MLIVFPHVLGEWGHISTGTYVFVFANYRHLGYERVYLPLGKVADAPFHIQGDVMLLRNEM